MIERYPKYAALFHCSASACSDTCCRGWEIDIDPDSLSKYRAHNGALKPRFEKEISEGDNPHFRLGEGERCPFLNGENLCDIYITMGESALCEICTEHPRFYDVFDGIREMGIGLACEEAAKLILQNGDYAFLPVRTKGKWDKLLSFRESILADPKKYAAFLKNDFFLWKKEEIVRISEYLLSFEICKEQWRDVLLKMREAGEQLIAAKEQLLKKRRETESELLNIFRYFIYRHFMKARFCEETASGTEAMLLFANLCTALILLCDALSAKENMSFEKQVDIAKLFSQEIEYDEDNTYALEELCITLLSDIRCREDGTEPRPPQFRGNGLPED